MPRQDHLVRDLIVQYGWNATCYQLLNPGIDHWVSDDCQGVVGYVNARKSALGKSRIRIAAGSPVCSEVTVETYSNAFENEALAEGYSVCWFAADSRLQNLRSQNPAYSTMALGAQPVWNPNDWQDIVASKASLRAQLNRAQNKGVCIQPLSAPEEHRLALRQCLSDWLSSRGLPPLHFLVEPQTLQLLNDRQVFGAFVGSTLVAFLVLSPVPARKGWLVEQIVRGRDAPNGTATQLVDAAMQAAVASGSEYVTLGLSPLSMRGPSSKPNPLWLRVALGWVRAHGKRFYNFEGLEAFKAKFEPSRWDPIVTITNEKHPSVGTLYAIADAFSGKITPERLVGRAVLHAIAEEIRGLRPSAKRA